MAFKTITGQRVLLKFDQMPFRFVIQWVEDGVTRRISVNKPGNSFMKNYDYRIFFEERECEEGKRNIWRTMKTIYNGFSGLKRCINANGVYFYGIVIEIAPYTEIPKDFGIGSISRKVGKDNIEESENLGI